MKQTIARGVLLAAVIALPLGMRLAAQSVPTRMMAVGDNIATVFLFVGDGPNTMAFGAEDGTITMIDTREPGSGASVSQKVQNGVEGTVTRIINTSANRATSNGEFPKVTEIIAHDNAKAAMAKMPQFAGTNAKFLPNKTFADTLSFKVKTLGEEDGTNRLDLYHFGPGSTNGDVAVVFVSANTVFMGDLFPGRSAPLIDTAKGGSAVAIVDTLDKAVKTLNAVPGLKIVVPGRMHPPPGPYVPRWLGLSDLEEYAAFNRAFLTAVKSAMAAGKTADQAASGLALPDKFKGYDMTQARANVQAIYAELKR